MAKAYPSDDETESIGRLGNSLSAETTRMREISTYNKRSFKDRDKATTMHGIPQSQMGDRKQENNTFCRSLFTEGDKVQHKHKHNTLQCIEKASLVRDKDKIFQSKTALSRSLEIKDTDSDRSRHYKISREERQQTRDRGGKDGLKCDVSLGKWQANKTKEVERQRRISTEENYRLKGNTSVDIVPLQNIKDSNGRLKCNSKLERKSIPKTNDSDVRKQCNMSAECIRKTRNRTDSNVCEVTMKTKQKGNLDGKQGPQKPISMGKGFRMKTNHDHDSQQYDLVNLKDHDMEACDEFLKRDGQEPTKKHDGDRGLHATSSNKTVQTPLQENDGNDGLRHAVLGETVKPLATKTDDDYGFHGVISKGTVQYDGDSRTKCAYSSKTVTTLVKKNDSNDGLHSAFSSETKKTLVKTNDGYYGTKSAVVSGAVRVKTVKIKDSSCEQHSDVLSGTMPNTTTIDIEFGIQGDTSSGTKQEMNTTDRTVSNACDISKGRLHLRSNNNSVDTDKVCKQTVLQSTEFKGRHTINLSELTELADYHGDPNILLLKIADRTNGFADIFDTNIRPDWLYYILKVLAEVSTSSHDRAFIEMLLKVEETFLPGLNIVLGEILIKNKLYSCIWENADFLCKTCLLILKVMQTLVQTIVSSVGKCKHILILIKEIQSLFLLHDEPLSIELQNANDIISVTVEQIDRNCRQVLTMSTDCANASGPLGAFREISILPTIDDIQTHANPSLSAIRLNGKYDNLDLYLDIHFRLLREDFIYPLRQGISEYVQNLYDLTPNKKIREIKIYKNVKIIYPNLDNEETSHRIRFDIAHLKDVDWTESSRLMCGSLLCLSCDNFRTISFATVINRKLELLNKGLVEVQFENEPLTNTYALFVMIESTSYFEAFRHVLAGLQSVDSSLPFQRYILDCNRAIKPPSYLLGVGVPLYDFACILQNNSQKKTSTNIPVLNTARWPTSEDLRLDTSQYEALQLALTKELTIIQGPPGTGKTFIGLQIAKLLLENKSYWKDSMQGGTPILVVCNTNHALDQFLEGILRFCEGKIVRIGGRCKNKALEPYLLFNLKKNRSGSLFYYKIEVARSEQSRKEHKVHMLLSAQRKTFTEVQPYTSLEAHMTDTQRTDFEVHVTNKHLLMTEWLNITPTPLIHNKNIDVHNGAMLLWVRYLSDDVKKMPKHETHRVFDVYEIDLLSRAELYKAWLAEFQTRAHTISSSYTESKSRTGCLKRKVHTKIVYPIDMLKYIMSKQTKRQLSKVRKVVDFEAWLAIDGSMQSTKLIYRVFNAFINDSEYTPMDWVRQWNAKYETKNITEISKDVRDLSDEKDTGMVNMWSLPIADRRRLYWHWVCKLRDRLEKQADHIKETYIDMPRAIAKIREDETKEVLRSNNVIGMTTTGAAKHRKLLQSIQPVIVIVEEAAQVLESHIITALNENCKHLILIGDHQQLRPSTSVYHLAQKYHLDISLFERMVLNGIPCVTLSEQHRMRPEVSVLLKNEYLYPELRDHNVVSEYEHISGVDSDVFFIEHSEKEVHIDDSASYQNPHEAKFTVRLCNYLLKQGYERSQLTILTPYMGQVTLLKKEMHNLKLDDVHVTAVDNFQGEENDIILLSLVRSSTALNRKNQIGFLAIANRVCVALSRAKKGFYVIGNFALMKEYSLLWKHNVSLMAKENRIGQEITLRCKNHPTTIIKASRYDDFDNAPEGGCTEPCLTLLKCNHTCPKICHIIDRDHAEAKCMEACVLVLPECGHKCKKQCFEKCDPCTTEVEKEIPFCGHRVYMPCSLDPDNWKCQIDCEFLLQCGHVCSRKCNKCKRKNGHENNCKTLVIKELTCGHAPQELPCYQDPHCTELCRVSLPCGHEADVTCDYKTNFLHKYKCAMRVSKTLLCGHILELPCFKDPSTAKCKESISVTLQCGHVSELLCSQNPHIIMCNTPCGAELSCRHVCTGTCGTCFGGKIHHPCEQTCQKSLPCGHTCRYRCGDVCPPCNLPCEWICSHGNKCRKKCSEKCDPCRRKCNYGCIHSRCTKSCYELCDTKQCNKRCTKRLACGHTCTGLCGEICVCSKFCSVKENKIYYRKDKDTVYIRMPACGCIIPQNVLDDYMSRPDILKRCMVCQKVVSSYFQRYSNIIKHTLNAVYQELRSMEASEKVSDKRRYKYILINRVHRLRDIGLDKSDVNILKARLKNSTFDALNVIEKTVDMLVELLMASKIRLAVPEPDLAIKPSELIKLLLRERKYGTAQFWEEIRNEIKRIGDFRRLKNMRQEAVEECSDCDTEILTDTEDDTL